MSNTMILIILCLSFIGFVVCMYKGFNSMLCFIAVSAIWSLCAGTGLLGTLDLFAKGAASGASTMLLIIMGSWFGHLMMETGIISGIIKKAVEFSGGKPYVICSLLCLVTAFIFITGYGSGVVIAVGVIVLPIMFSLGVPKVIAASSFAISIGAGLYLNPTIYNLTTASIKDLISDGSKSAYYSFAFIPLILQIIVTIVHFIISTRKSAGFKTSAWAAEVADNSSKDVPAISFIIPIVPILFYMIAKIDMVPIYYITFAILLLLTGNFGKGKKPLAILMKALKDGVSDVAVLYGYIIGLQTFVTAAGSVREILGGFVSNILPSSPLVLVLAVAALAPLALYRGPLAPVGGGVALIFALVSSGLYSELFLLVLIMMVSVSICFSFCPTVGWNAWITNYTQVAMSGYIKRSLIQQWPFILVMLLLTYFMFA